MKIKNSAKLLDFVYEINEPIHVSIPANTKCLSSLCYCYLQSSGVLKTILTFNINYKFAHCQDHPHVH